MINQVKIVTIVTIVKLVKNNLFNNPGAVIDNFKKFNI